MKMFELFVLLLDYFILDNFYRSRDIVTRPCGLQER